MPADAAGELFVKLRPDSTGFTTEAEGPISNAAKDLSKVFLAAFAVGGIAKTIESVVKSVTEHESSFASLDQTVQNAGASSDLFGQSLEALLEKEARLKGFSDEDLASSFQRLVSVTHDSAEAFALLGDAENLARFRHVDVAAAALAVEKQYEGNNQSLQRYGFTAVKVTTDVDALKEKYTQLQEAGGKLDTAQKAVYASALKAAAAHDKQASSAATLAEVEQRVGGASATFADTAAGQFARLQQDFHQFEVTVGEDLLPSLASAAEALGTFFTKASQNKEVQQDLTTFFHDVGVGLGDIKSVAETVGPPLLDVAHEVGGVTHALELLGLIVIGGKLSGGLYATAAAETAVGAEAVTATTAVDLFEASLVRLAALAAAAIPVVISVEIDKHDSGLEHQISDFTHNVGKLLHENIPKGDDLLSTLIGDPGRAGVLGNEIWKLVGAPAKAAGQQAGDDFFGGIFDEAHTALAGAGASTALAEIFLPLNSALAAAGDAAKLTSQKKASDAGAAAAKAAADALRDGITSDQSDLQQLAAEMSDAVTQGAQAVDQAVESAKQNFTSIGQSLAASIGTFLTKPLTDAGTALGAEGDRIALQFDTVNAKLTAQASILNLASERLSQQSAARAAQFAGENALLTQEQNRIGLRSDQQNLANLRREIVLPGGKSLSDDTKTALAQLNELEKKTKDPALQAFIAEFQGGGIKVAQDKIGIATTPNPREAQQAADLGVKSGAVSLAQAGLAARKQLTDTATQLKRDHLQVLQDAAAFETQTATTMLANLTDLFDKGQLKFAVFSKDVAVILKGAGLTPAAALKVGGVAFADTVAGEQTGLTQQAAALRAGPQRAGTGLVPSIVRPLDTLNQSQKQIASIASQERGKQLDESKKQTSLLTKIRAGQTATAFTNSLKKNPTNASKLQQDLAGVAG